MPLSFAAVFLAGVVTILSPCILPILPPFLAASLAQSRYKPIFIALGLMVGFTGVGILITVFGQALGISVFTFRKIAIVFFAVFGLLLIFPELSARLFSYLPHIRINANKPSILSGFFTGLGLGFAWIPCIGPILGAVLAFAATKQSLSLSIIYFLLYSLGAGIPLLLLAYFSNRLVDKFRWLATRTEKIKQVAGLILVLVAISFIFNWDRVVQAWVVRHYPGLTL